MSAAERATTVCEQIRCRPTTISPWSASGCDGPAPLSEFKPEEQAALARYGAEGDASALRLTGLRFSKLGPRLHQRVPRWDIFNERLEATLTDPVGLIPNSQSGLNTGAGNTPLPDGARPERDLARRRRALRVMEYTEENPASLVRTIPRLDDWGPRAMKRGRRANQRHALYKCGWRPPKKTAGGGDQV